MTTESLKKQISFFTVGFNKKNNTPTIQVILTTQHAFLT